MVDLGRLSISMKSWTPIFIENSKIPVWLSKIAPINISAITLFFIVFSRGEISTRTMRHETIHFQQYLETGVIGFLLLYLYYYLRAALKHGFSRDAYLAIKFEQEAHEHDHGMEYLIYRKRYSWLRYKI
jgi:cbb3-type cytochrome oxidase subunit 3